jgi:hypothetical protein
MFYTRNSARQPVQTRATTQQTPPHSAVIINADHLHKSELHTNYIRDRLGIQTKPPAAQRATRSAFYPVSLLTFVCLCNISLDKCTTCWPELGLVTGWALRGSNPGGGRDLLHLSRLALRTTQPPVQWAPSSFPGVKRPGHGVDHPSPSTAKVKERVQLHLNSPSGPSWPVMG